MNREQESIALMFLTGRDNEVDKSLALKLVLMTISLNHLTHELTTRARNLLSRTMNLAGGTEERRLVESYKFNGWELTSTAVH